MKQAEKPYKRKKQVDKDVKLTDDQLDYLLYVEDITKDEALANINWS